MYKLTANVIQSFYKNSDLNEKYYAFFESKVKQMYNEMESEDPDCDHEEGEETNVDVSLKIALETTMYYAEEFEKGHSALWAEAYALDKVCFVNEDEIVRTAYEFIEDKNDAERELDIYLNGISDDPLYHSRYKFFFKGHDSDIRIRTEDYCKTYHSCINAGKSEYYAHAYADSLTEYSGEEYWSVYAQAYDAAKQHGMSDIDAYAFGYKCIEGTEHGYVSEINLFLKHYKEIWQKKLYLQLIIDDMNDKRSRYPYDDQLIADICRELGL